MITVDLLAVPIFVTHCCGALRLKIVVDHMGKPDFKTGGSAQWEEGMQELAKHKNVYVKLSGMVTEAAENKAWKTADFKPLVEVIDKFTSISLVWSYLFTVFFCFLMLKMPF